LHKEPSADDFKQIHIKLSRKDQVAAKPNKLNRIKKQEFLIQGKTEEKPKRNYRWTNLENQFKNRSNKFSAEVDKARAERSDYDALFSSFNPGGTFVPPPSSIEILHKQKERLNKTSVSGTLTNKSIGGGRAATAIPLEGTLIGSGNNTSNLFTRVGTVEGSPSKFGNRSFKNSTDLGIRSSAFKQL